MDTGESHGGAPESAGPRIRKPHPVATASALVAGAVVLVCGGLVAGTLWGPRVLRAWVPTLADDLGVLVEPEPEVERLDDGYDGELARRVAAVSADIVRTALDAPTLDEATAGALQGLVSAADPDGAYLSSAAYGRLAGEDEDAGSAAAGEENRDDADGAMADDAEDGDGPDAADGASAAGGMSDAAETSARATARLVGSVGVLTLSDLGTGAADELAAAVSDLLDQGARGFVLDLRGNPGGSLNEAVAAASLFLDGGTVVQTVDGAGDRDRVFADPDAQLTDAPLVVLVSDGTGSAAEALVAGLQDHARCVTVGQRTAGRGTLQTLKTLSFGGAVAFATASFATPDGNEVEGVGLTPDVEVAAPSVSADGAAGEGDAGSADAGAGPDAGADGSGATDAEAAGGTDRSAADAELGDAAADNEPAGEAVGDDGTGEASVNGMAGDGASVPDGSTASGDVDGGLADGGPDVSPDEGLADDEALARALAAVEAWMETGSRAQAIEAARAYVFEPDASVSDGAAEPADGQAPSDTSDALASDTPAAGSAPADDTAGPAADGRAPSDASAGVGSAASGDGAQTADPDAAADTADPAAPAGPDAVDASSSDTPSA